MSKQVMRYQNALVSLSELDGLMNQLSGEGWMLFPPVVYVGLPVFTEEPKFLVTMSRMESLATERKEEG